MAYIAAVFALSSFASAGAFVVPNIADTSRVPQTSPQLGHQSTSVQVPGINVNESDCFASTSLLVGLALGLVVGFAGALAPAAAAEETQLLVSADQMENNSESLVKEVSLHRGNFRLSKQGYVAVGPGHDVAAAESDAKALIERMSKLSAELNSSHASAPFSWRGSMRDLDGITINTKTI